MGKMSMKSEGILLLSQLISFDVDLGLIQYRNEIMGLEIGHSNRFDNIFHCVFE